MTTKKQNKMKYCACRAPHPHMDISKRHFSCPSEEMLIWRKPMSVKLQPIQYFRTFIMCFTWMNGMNMHLSTLLTNTICWYHHVLWETHSVAAHLFPAVAVISLQMPFDDSMWRAGLTLQEGTASLHPVLHHLQSVLIGCGAEREKVISMATKTLITMNSLRPKSQLWQIKVLYGIQLSKMTIKVPEYSHYSP